MNTWDNKFIALAEYVATWSKDESTKVGAVIVDEESKDIISMGYNGLPRGCNDNVPERQERPLKYSWFEHAERNSIYNAARHGKATNGKTMYLQWFPCKDCARAIIQSGIKKVVCFEPDFEHPRYGDSFKISSEMFGESGVEVVFAEKE